MTGGDNLITAFYLLSSSSSRLAGSLASPSPTSCRYGNLKPGKKPGVVAGGGGPGGRGGGGGTPGGGLGISSSPAGNSRRRGSRGFLICCVDKAHLNLTESGVVVRVTARSLVHTRLSDHLLVSLKATIRLDGFAFTQETDSPLSSPVVY